MRDNSLRVGTNLTHTEDSSTQQIINQEKSDFSLPKPTELVTLPTQGKFYPQDHPLYNQETIEIRLMTAKDEEILNSKTLLEKGIAVDKMIQGLIEDKRIKVDSLFIGDKNAIILAARNSGYDSPYTISVTCGTCGRSSPKEVDLKSIKPKLPAENVQISEAGTFNIILPQTKTVVEMRLLTGIDEKDLKALTDKKVKLKLPEAPITDQLKKIIVSINGDSRGEVVEQFVDTLLARYSRFIREEYSRIIPNIDMKTDFECTCGAESLITIPFTANFFWPNR